MSLVDTIPEILEPHKPASLERIRALATELALQLPSQYEQFLAEADGIYASEVQIYSCDSVPERNGTYEVPIYAPGYILIASVNSFPVLLRSGESSPVYQGDWGSMDPDYFVVLAPSLVEWVEMGCPDREDINDSQSPSRTR